MVFSAPFPVSRSVTMATHLNHQIRWKRSAETDKRKRSAESRAKHGHWVPLFGQSWTGFSTRSSFLPQMFGERAKYGRWVPVGLVSVGRSESEERRPAGGFGCRLVGSELVESQLQVFPGAPGKKCHHVRVHSVQRPHSQLSSLQSVYKAQVHE